MTLGISGFGSTVPWCRKMVAAFDAAKRSPKLGQPALEFSGVMKRGRGRR
jgi:hypothetical protein